MASLLTQSFYLFSSLYFILSDSPQFNGGRLTGACTSCRPLLQYMLGRFSAGRHAGPVVFALIDMLVSASPEYYPSRDQLLSCQH